MYPALWYDSSQRFFMSIGFGSSAARSPTHSLTHPLTLSLHSLVPLAKPGPFSAAWRPCCAAGTRTRHMEGARCVECSRLAQGACRPTFGGSRHPLHQVRTPSRWDARAPPCLFATAPRGSSTAYLLALGAHVHAQFLCGQGTCIVRTRHLNAVCPSMVPYRCQCVLAAVLTLPPPCCAGDHWLPLLTEHTDG